MSNAAGSSAGAAARGGTRRAVGGQPLGTSASADEPVWLGEPAGFTDFGMLDEQAELDELGSMGIKGAGDVRRSPMSVGKYNQWTLVEANRQLGVRMREEEEDLQRRREASTAAYHAARRAKTSVGRGQMELTRGSVVKYRGELARCGAEGKVQLDAIRQKALRQKAEWAAHGREEIGPDSADDEDAPPLEQPSSLVQSRETLRWRRRWRGRGCGWLRRRRWRP